MKVTGAIKNFRAWLSTGTVLACLVLLSTSAVAQVGNAANGKILYVMNSCDSCHGVPPDTRALRGADKPSVISQAFLNVQQMNIYINVFTQAEINDIAAY